MSTYQLSYTGEKIQNLLEKTDNIDLNNLASTTYVDEQNAAIQAQLENKQNKSLNFTTTVPYQDWIQDDKGAYINFVKVIGLLSTDTDFLVTPVLNEVDQEIRLNQLNAWSYVSAIIANDDAIKIICDKAAPTYPVSITLKVTR